MSFFPSKRVSAIDGLMPDFNRPQVGERVKSLLHETKIPFIYIYDTNESLNESYMIAPSHSQIGGLVGKAFCEAGYTRFVEIIGPQDRIDVIHKHEALHVFCISMGISCQIRTFCMQITT